MKRIYRSIKLLSLSILILPTAANAAIDLDFSGYIGGSQPDQALTGTNTVYDGLTGLFYNDVADEDTTGIYIIARLEAVSAYTAANTSANGRTGTNIQVNQAANNGLTSYRLSLYDGLTGNLFTNGGSSFEFDLVIYDIDGTGNVESIGLETFTILTPASFQLTDTTTVAFDGSNSFSNGGAGAEVSNPTTNDLDATQEDASVILSFMNQNIVNFNFTTAGNGSGGRNFFIDGQDFVVFDDALSTGINNGSIVPEPSAYAFLLGLVVLGIATTRRSVV
ncbi:MAG: hypothetical protein AAF065_01120 [Verrucomicrobiota bacterium]